MLLAKAVQKYSDKILLSSKAEWSENKNTATVALTGSENARFQCSFLKKKGMSIISVAQERLTVGPCELQPRLQQLLSVRITVGKMDEK